MPMKCIDQMPVPMENAPPTSQYRAALVPRVTDTRDARSRAT